MKNRLEKNVDFMRRFDGYIIYFQYKKANNIQLTVGHDVHVSLHTGHDEFLSNHVCIELP
jgi:hypothetical protein